ncbi:EF-hand domain-containing protein [uncultured Cohaesibacter sp.]|uniref:EF-hand domain-containing protein n=1 Tax=uncultured Cohaesibacter sp. TaxID=1002546 RepID=UPI00292F75F4|nr:EF-hand domain-containing protein [uncultured Cohaesibacter sp.]
MKNATKIALALALVTGVSATALTIDSASAWGWNNQQGQGQGQNWNGPRGGGKAGFNRGPRGGQMGQMGPMGGMGMAGGFMGAGGPQAGGFMMLQQFDTNNDGALTKEELTAGLEKKITENDTDGDKSVSLEEFKAEWLKLTQPMMVRAFQHMDRDASGKITLEEVTAPVEMMFTFRDTNKDGKIDQSDMIGRGGKFGGRGYFMQPNTPPAPALAPAPEAQ